MNQTIDWGRVETVLLDMDGTLLDLRFDNHFWLEHLPRRYAEARGVPEGVARAELLGRYRAVEGTMAWYCVDYWTEQLGLDVALLKEEVRHLITVHPHVIEFLESLKQAGRRRVLVTNAHGKAIRLKMRRTPIGAHLDEVVCAHDLGLPKEDVRFWDRLRGRVEFDPAAALLIDDSLPVLRAAARWGIGQLLAVRQPDSTQAEREIGEFAAVRHFRELVGQLARGG